MAELAPIFGIEEHILRGVSDQPDHLLGPKVVHAIDQLRERSAHDLAIRKNTIASVAARALAQGARWTVDGVSLDPAVLLGDLLADDSLKFVVFDLDGKDVAVQRSVLLAAARVLRTKQDLTALVAPKGLHLRWGSSRGGINWYPQRVSAEERDLVLRVELVRQPERVHVTARPRPRWSWDAFLEVALP